MRIGRHGLLVAPLLTCAFVSADESGFVTGMFACKKESRYFHRVEFAQRWEKDECSQIACYSALPGHNLSSRPVLKTDRCSHIDGTQAWPAADWTLPPGTAGSPYYMPTPGSCSNATTPPAPSLTEYSDAQCTNPTGKVLANPDSCESFPVGFVRLMTIVNAAELSEYQQTTTYPEYKVTCIPSMARRHGTPAFSCAACVLLSLFLVASRRR
mmetsp:Transcript_66449/g.142239  ORF Transcript_66449/g.142239 Transcript_66449/m.142239 type:complete len:212 (-) Transcript_66449:46-681(-)